MGGKKDKLFIYLIWEVPILDTLRVSDKMNEVYVGKSLC